MSKAARIKASLSRGKKVVTKSSPTSSATPGAEPKKKKKVSPNPKCHLVCRHARGGHCSLGLKAGGAIGYCNFRRWSSHQPRS